MILFAAICIYGGLYYFGYTNKVKKRGIETIATVTRIEEEREEHSSGQVHVKQTVYVSFTDEAGQNVDARLVLTEQKLQENMKIRIKYLAERSRDPVFIDFV